MGTNLDRGLILTISVAAYNTEQFIDECLDSFTEEKFVGKLEVLIIDDGGTDSTLKHAAEYQCKYPGIFRSIHKENGGWGSVINTAINEAKGKYYKHVDADDYYDKKSLLKLINDLEKTDVDIFFTPYMQFDDSTKEVTFSNKGNESSVLNKVISIQDFDEKATQINMHSCCYRTQMLRDNHIQLLEHHFYTDAELYIKCLGVAQNAYMVDYIVYCYRFGRSGQSCSTEGIKKHYKELKDVVDSLILFNEANVVSPINKNIVRRHVGEQALCYMSFCKVVRDYDEMKLAYEYVINNYEVDASHLGRYRIYHKLGWKFIPILDPIFDLRVSIINNLNRKNHE